MEFIVIILLLIALLLFCMKRLDKRIMKLKQQRIDLKTMNWEDYVKKYYPKNPNYQPPEHAKWLAKKFPHLLN